MDVTSVPIPVLQSIYASDHFGSVRKQENSLARVSSKNEPSRSYGSRSAPVFQTKLVPTCKVEPKFFFAVREMHLPLDVTDQGLNFLCIAWSADDEVDHTLWNNPIFVLATLSLSENDLELNLFQH